ncbi:DMT family transporter [Leptolyngbya sp. AN03gr2]|uniref:DMT family transporter n=1 Tax=unclassified Leptolyngbya TaxID=2650499 RepID=UPI003D31455A
MQCERGSIKFLLEYSFTLDYPFEKGRKSGRVVPSPLGWNFVQLARTFNGKTNAKELTRFLQKIVPNSIQLTRFPARLPGQLYLWLAVLIFGASSAVTRKITQLGAQHFIDGQNPISLCNVLFVGNLCALLVLLALYNRQWNRANLKQLSRRDWLNLSIVSLLSGAIAPALLFQALALSPVNNVVLIGRLEPPLTFALSVWFLQERSNRWEAFGTITAFIGVFLTIALRSSSQMMRVGIFSIGVGELFAAIAAIALAISTIIGKKQLSQVPLGIYGIFRTALGTIVFFFAALLLYGDHHFAGIFSPFLWRWMLVYGSIIVVLGQSFWIRGLRASTVSTASIVSSFTPIIGVLAAYWILDEVPTQAQYIGGSVILAGLLLGQVGNFRIARRTIRHQTSVQTDSQQSESMEVENGIGFKGI